MDMEAGYRLAFDVSVSGYRHWWFPARGCAAFIAGVVWVWLRRRWPGPQRSWIGRAQPYFLAISAAVWTALSFGFTHMEYRHLRTALESGRYVLVEGTVTAFVPTSPGGHWMERFEVNGRHYAYSDSLLQAGFNNTRSHGGPIHEGLRVRIADVGGQIARLEVAE